MMPIASLLLLVALINDAHAKGLFVHTYTFRNESGFLASDYKNNPEAEYRQFINLGIDGYFTDFPGQAMSFAIALLVRKSDRLKIRRFSPLLNSTPLMAKRRS